MWPLVLKSPNFEHMSSIPTRYTCDGDNVSPALQWYGVPKETKSLVLIFDDPDIPAGIKNSSGEPIAVWDHWVLFNIPASVVELPEDVRDLPKGTRCGKLSNGGEEYHGPCPPDKRHNYFFKLYALNGFLSLESEVTKTEVEAAMKGYVIGEAQLVGTYDRPRE